MICQVGGGVGCYVIISIEHGYCKRGGVSTGGCSWYRV